MCVVTGAAAAAGGALHGPGMLDAEVLIWMGDFNYRSVQGSGERMG
jgi:hypothetical protein